MLLNQLQNSLATQLATLVNKSIADRVVPDSLKIAKVIPIFKSKDKDVVENYESICILTTISITKRSKDKDVIDL